MRTRVLAVAVAVLVLPVNIFAATWTVKPDGTGDFPTIQAAVNAAVANDLILLTDGTFSGAGNRNVSYLGKAITIQSVNGAGAVTIDCGGQPGFRFVTQETSAAVLRGVTIINATLAISCHPGSPLISSCIINGATTGLEAGVFLNESPKPANAQVSSCTFNACGTAMQTLEFGSIACSNSSVTGSTYSAYAGLLGGSFTATNSQFNSNGTGASFNGIGVFAGGSLSGCSFVGNAGNAITMSGNMFVTVSNCYFEGNHQAIRASSNPTVGISGCTFVNNSAINGGQYNDGGAIWADGSSPMPITDSVFCGNSAFGRGGAIFILDSGFTIRGNTFVRNSSVTGGGAVHLTGSYSTGDVQRNIFAFSTLGAGVLCASGATPTLSCNDIYGNAGGDAICGTDGGSNFSLDPQFCSQTCADVGLTSSSPCTATNSPCGIQVGAMGVTCTPVPVLFQSASARLTDKSVVVSWSAIADETIVKFSIVRAAGDASRVIADGLAVDAHEFVDKTVQPNSAYRYTVVATTSGGDVFQSQAIDVKTPRAELELSQNQPNPFNPSTRIDYSLPGTSVVDIAVFDVAGRRVATLVAGPRPAGRGSVVWGGRDDDGQSVASGIYVCRMAANGDVRTMKMVLLK